MNYVLTGSTGHITKPLAEKLIAAGHKVSIVSSKPERAAEIANLGAKALIGTVSDAGFLAASFSGADAVYLMIPPNFGVRDWFGYQQEITHHFISAIKASGVKKVVLLSSVGAHMKKGCGPVDGLGYAEDELEKLQGVDVLALRPSYFFYNLFGQIGMIKNMGIVGSAQPANHKLVLTDTRDIADVAFEVLNDLTFKGFSTKYIASDERTWIEIAEALGEAAGKPGTPYVEFTDEQSQQGMMQMGLPATIIEGFLAMGKALREGTMEEDYFNNRPAQLGKTKLEDFARVFAQAYARS